jgi:hypothetical protein
MDQEWVPMHRAAKIIGIHPSKISRLATLGKIKTKKNPKDDRVTLVDMVELRKIFEPQEEN